MALEIVGRTRAVDRVAEGQLARIAELGLSCAALLQAGRSLDVSILGRYAEWLSDGDAHQRKMHADLLAITGESVVGTEALAAFDTGIQRKPLDQLATIADAHWSARSWVFRPREVTPGAGALLTLRGLDIPVYCSASADVHATPLALAGVMGVNEFGRRTVDRPAAPDRMAAAVIAPLICFSVAAAEQVLGAPSARQAVAIVDELFYAPDSEGREPRS